LRIPSQPEVVSTYRQSRSTLESVCSARIAWLASLFSFFKSKFLFFSRQNADLSTLHSEQKHRGVDGLNDR
jgi:hypothetical protein